MYITIGLILASTLAFLISGPIFLYITDKFREEETPPKPPVENYLKALEYAAKKDIDILKILAVITVASFILCLLIWPLFLAVAIVLAGLYFISVNKQIRDKSTEILDNITQNLEDYAEEKEGY